MRVRLDAGALARFLGHPEGYAAAPGELSAEVVIATLDVSPFLVSEQPTDGDVGYQPAAGRGSIVRKRYGAQTAGTEFSVTIPTGEAWRPLLWFVRFVCSAAVASRSLALFIDDGATSNPYYRDTTINEMAASESWDHSWGIGALTREDTAEDRQIRPFPDCILTPGMRIRTNTLNIQAGDQITVVDLLYERL